MNAISMHTIVPATIRRPTTLLRRVDERLASEDGSISRSWLWGDHDVTVLPVLRRLIDGAGFARELGLAAASCRSLLGAI
jgi:hypothetical protein